MSKGVECTPIMTFRNNTDDKLVSSSNENRKLKTVLEQHKITIEESKTEVKRRMASFPVS